VWVNRMGAETDSGPDLQSGQLARPSRQA
jgi:hypothetical protein